MIQRTDGSDDTVVWYAVCDRECDTYFVVHKEATVFVLEKLFCSKRLLTMSRASVAHFKRRQQYVYAQSRTVGCPLARQVG